ncbi:serine hydrolase domain-containing protein [Streptomyces beigongshangae]|uniref:serine hydrolase domain-containing protein n=1 Tax=Streptomyces beigongshangae TaxID=2841597 RepID=UPI001C862CDB|nr:serine hydrolase domain-containing protein [Streptomyces sp. REN17]
MKTGLTARVAVTALATALAGIALTLPAAGATGSAAGSATGFAVGSPAGSAAAPAHHGTYAPPHGTPQGRSPAPTHGGRTLQAHVDAVFRTGPVGVVALSAGPRGSRHATAGLADRATGDPARPGDRFRIASTTKTFVATVMLQLVGEGRVSLDDTVEHWLPGAVSGNGNDGGAITVRQLLQHTSGLFDYAADLPVFTSTDGYRADRYTTWTPEQLVAVATEHVPNFAPGEGWGYSNTNYILAGMIIQKATGHSWEREVTARVIRPLGLRDTTAPTTYPRISGRHLRGYSSFGEDRAPIDVTDLNPTAGGAAGAMISTTADLSRFYRALLGGRLLRPAELALMRTAVRAPELDRGWPGARYGLGLMEVPLSCGGTYYGHGGDLPGYTTRNGVSGDGRRAVVLQATGDGSADWSTQETANALIDDELCT